jgi:uncharacterized protein (TIRG00374 family)
MLRWLFLIVGLALLGWVLSQADLNALADAVSTIGWGVLLVLAVYALVFTADTGVWLLTIQSFRPDARHLSRAWKIRIVGELFNVITPLAGFGGEPVKAALLKRHHGIALREGAASVILYRTVTTLALVAFLGGGFILAMNAPAFPDTQKLIAGIGLAALSLGIALFYLVQRYRITSLTGTWLSTKRLGRMIGGILHHIHDLDERLVRFYTQDPRRLAGAFALSCLAWLLGAFEIYVTLHLLGHPVSYWEAWIIEGAAQLVRAGTFLIPASLGAQDGALFLIGAAMTGQPTTGLALAVIRRFRELVWLLGGALVGWSYMRAK